MDRSQDKNDAHFGASKSAPLLEAQRMYLRREQKVTEYFKEKVTLLRLTSLNEQEIVDQLTAGLPISWQQTMAVMPISETCAWQEAATRLELVQTKQSNKASKEKFKPKPTKQKPVQVLTANKKPYTPCRFCQKLKKTEYHWHSECPNNPTSATPSTSTDKKKSTKQKVQAAQADTDSSDSSKSSDEEFINTLND